MRKTKKDTRPEFKSPIAAKLARLGGRSDDGITVAEVCTTLAEAIHTILDDDDDEARELALFALLQYIHQSSGCEQAMIAASYTFSRTNLAQAAQWNVFEQWAEKGAAQL